MTIVLRLNKRIQRHLESILRCVFGWRCTGEPRPSCHDRFGLEGFATAMVDVVREVALYPITAQVGLNHQFTFSQMVGLVITSTAFLKTLGFSVSADGQYTAGDQPGVDVVLVTDPATGLDAKATIEVLEAPAFGAGASPLYACWYLYQVEITGGSGHIQVVGGDGCAHDESTRVVTALQSGQTTLQVTDRYSGMSLDLNGCRHPLYALAKVRYR